MKYDVKLLEEKSDGELRLTADAVERESKLRDIRNCTINVLFLRETSKHGYSYVVRYESGLYENEYHIYFDKKLKPRLHEFIFDPDHFGNETIEDWLNHRDKTTAEQRKDSLEFIMLQVNKIVNEPANRLHFLLKGVIQ